MKRPPRRPIYGASPGLLGAVAGSLIASGCLLLCSSPAPAQGTPWKACSFNDQPIPCRDMHSRDGSVLIVWSDGQAMTYRLFKAGFPRSILRVSLGGLWEREVLIQGNAVFRNKGNGNRIDHGATALGPVVPPQPLPCHPHCPAQPCRPSLVRSNTSSG